MNYKDINMYKKLNKLQRYGLTNIHISRQGLIVNDMILIAKSKNRFKMLGELDWVYYPRINILYNKLKDNTIKEYHKELLSHEKSPKNNWKDKKMEKRLKKYYKERSNNYKTNGYHYYNETDSHLGCPSYPNCDIDRNGCVHEVGMDNVEWYGHRDTERKKKKKQQ
jgi:hypothetical protein